MPAARDTEYAVARKGTRVIVAKRARQGDAWSLLSKSDYKTEGEAKAAHKRKLDKVIAKFPNNIVRSQT